MTTTRERAINLRDWEVRAHQEGRLKLLVRPVKVNPAKARGGLILKGYLDEYGDSFGGLIVEDGKLWHRNTYESPLPEHDHAYLMPCPFGKPGDRLRGREAWQSVPFGPHRDWPGCPDLRPRKTCELNRARVVIWRADGEMPGPEIWRPSIHMPRWAVRNWLEITDVRCGRVREMSDDDLAAAGFPPDNRPPHDGTRLTLYGRRMTFAYYYETDHGEASWDRNDWVWMIGVKRIEVAS